MRLIDANKLKAEFTGNFQDEYCIAQIKAMIDIQPTVEVEPMKHGRWGMESITLVPDENGKFSGESLYACSECGWGCSCERELSFNYCPNCGARMDEGECHDD